MIEPLFVVHESSGVEYRSPRQLAFEFAKDYSTILVNPPTRWCRVRAARLSSRLRRPSKSLTVYSPYELPRRWGLHPLTDPWNAHWWRKELRALYASSGQRVVIFDRPGQYGRVGLLKEHVSAYYAHCDYTVDIIGRRDERTVELERQMLRSVDLVFAASDLLVERFALEAKRVVHLPCAYNGGLFDGAKAFPIPETLRNISRPRILFSGYISGRVDFVGLLRTVQARPDWRLILVGSISRGIEKELRDSGRSPNLADQLFAEPNVHYLGCVTLAEVPAIVDACDVGLVPYCLSSFTVTSSPIKTFEYLALGKPVVSTSVPETTCLSDKILVATEGESYVASIEAALSQVDPLSVARRKESVRNHSMQARAQTVVAAVENVLAEKNNR